MKIAFKDTHRSEQTRLRGAEPPRPSTSRATTELELKSTGHTACDLPTTADDVTGVGPSNEPWISRPARDCVGLALSGGGIRSSSFSLGLLQALDECRVLPLVDYLSTVSGGGYTGGFWTAWAQRRDPSASVDGPVFPRSDAGAGSEPGTPATQEPREIRHLREYSRFLAPRSSLIHVDLWEGALAAIGGAVPTLLTTTAIVAVFLLSWRYVLLRFQHAWIVEDSGFVPIVGIALLALFAWLVALEHRWRRLRIDRPPPAVVTKPSTGTTLQDVWHFIALFLAPTLGVGAFLLIWLTRAQIPALRDLQQLHDTPMCGTTTWFTMLGDPTTCVPPIIELAIPLVLALAGGLLWLVRGLVPSWLELSRSDRNDPADLGRALERTAARLLFVALFFAGLAATWMLTSLVPHYGGLAGLWEVIATGAISGALTLVLHQLRDLLLSPPKEGEAGVGQRLRALAPQVIAMLGALFLIAFVGIGCRWVVQVLRASGHGLENLAWVLPIGAVLLVLDWPRAGLREFYRRRLARAFVLFDAEDPPRDRDWLCRAKASPPPMRPIHLVCCAANDVASDPLRTLYRGARSAVLSAEGLTMGDITRRHDIRLSDALTASAAAFNTQMGGMSLQMGRAVSFLMGAFNLRLGLWLERGEGTSPWLFVPGIRLVTEMLGLTRQTDRWVHLSDGGHFENLALYELVRRHCRYVIVSDSGADPEVRFDDLSNAIRRVREDFGVEIEIDVEPLRPDAKGFSRQHVVVGVIHYDGRSGLDKGVLVYVKPSLTGDEPPDVMQYRARNEAFPHESTGDQFFDEPQWESYRRLGEHCGRVVFRYVGDLSREQIARRERVFSEAARVWQPVPLDFESRFLALKDRCTTLESSLVADMPTWLAAEFAPEIAATTEAQRERDDLVKAFAFMIQVAQLMEDAWLACRLESNWAHPLAEGWLGYLRRWAAMPTFRRFWPVLRPMFSPGFREFVKQRFGLRVVDPRLTPEARVDGARDARLRLVEVEAPQEGASGHHSLEYLLTLPGSADEVRVGQARICIDTECGVASWLTSDLVVPATLHGAGVVGKFLDRALLWCAEQGLDRAIVQVAATGPDARTIADEVDLYRSCGFRVERTPPAPSNAPACELPASDFHLVVDRLQGNLRAAETNE